MRCRIRPAGFRSDCRLKAAVSWIEISTDRPSDLPCSRSGQFDTMSRPQQSSHTLRNCFVLCRLSEKTSNSVHTSNWPSLENYLRNALGGHRILASVNPVGPTITSRDSDVLPSRSAECSPEVEPLPFVGSSERRCEGESHSIRRF
jgi:hypothetical protein